jgi:hypothetical protein
LACPDCESVVRRYSLTVTETVTVRDGVKYKARHDGGGKPFQEGVSGASLFRKTGEWHDVQRTIDRANNWYDEVVRGPDGEIVREVHEPLTDHVGRGSAKGRPT